VTKGPALLDTGPLVSFLSQNSPVILTFDFEADRLNLHHGHLYLARRRSDWIGTVDAFDRACRRQDCRRPPRYDASASATRPANWSKVRIS
jgi:hypothetical protein